jgi:carbon-monoxide dehydrogenase large subunit
VETAARELGVSPAELRANFIREFPHQTPVIMCYDAGDYEASLNAAMKAADYDGFAARKAEAKSRGKKRGIGMSCYIEACGIAPSAGGRFARRRRGPLGIGGSAGQRGRHGRGPDRLAQPRPGPRDHLRPAGIRPFRRAIDTVSIVHGDTDKVQMGMGTYGSRSGAVGMSAIVKALDKVEKKAKRIAAHLLEADESDIVIENGQVKVAGTDKSAVAGTRWRSTPTPPTTCRKAWSRG